MLTLLYYQAYYCTCKPSLDLKTRLGVIIIIEERSNAWIVTRWLIALDAMHDDDEL